MAVEPNIFKYVLNYVNNYRGKPYSFPEKNAFKLKPFDLYFRGSFYASTFSWSYFSSLDDRLDSLFLLNFSEKGCVFYLDFKNNYLNSLKTLKNMC